MRKSSLLCGEGGLPFNKRGLLFGKGGLPVKTVDLLVGLALVSASFGGREARGAAVAFRRVKAALFRS